MKKWCIERITDISNELCKELDEGKITDKNNLLKLYAYHKSNNTIHPITNWESHRLRVMSNIASKLKDRVKIWDCHYRILLYFYNKSHCQCHCNNDSEHLGPNHDFFHRDSLNYLVYGSQALLNACLYLKPFTHYDYKQMFNPIVEFIEPYLSHISDKNPSVLEIGIGTVSLDPPEGMNHVPANMSWWKENNPEYQPGNSLRAFRDFLKTGIIYGIDIQHYNLKEQTEKLSKYSQNQ
jgi:hypothetical protein